ncbi:general substrate transporter, partial [Bimuria novae-zelandiae CBS 107.79]
MAYLGLRGKSLQSAISLVCGLCFLCFGYAQGVMGGLLTVPAFLDRFPQVDTVNNASAHNAKVQGNEGAVVGVWNLGCLVSAILTMFLGDYLGRRKTIMMGLTFWVIGEIIQSSSYSFGQFIAGRAIAGFGNGFTTSTVPAYQAECVKSHRKGTILMISAGAFVAFGLALSYWLVFAFAYLSNFSAAWRVPIAFQIVFALVAFAVIVFMPESPRWLILTGREDAALKVLSALNDEDIEGPEIRDEFLQIKDAILVMAKGSSSSLTSNKERRNFHRAVLAYLVQVFQQMSGINLALQYLAIMMFNEFSYTGWLARLLGACAATFYFLSSFMAVIGIDRFWGKRWLMLFGASGMCLCMVLLTILGYLWQDHGVDGANIAQTVFLFAFLFFFAFGWQGMAWLYQVEVVPLRIRGPANALSTSGNWLFNFVVVFIAPIAFHNIGWKTYIIFAATNFVIVPLVYFFYPETAYRSLEEVDVLFHLANEAPGNPWLEIVKISLREPLWFGKKGDVPFDYEHSDWHQRYAQQTASGSGT